MAYPLCGDFLLSCLVDFEILLEFQFQRGPSKTEDDRLACARLTNEQRGIGRQIMQYRPFLFPCEPAILRG